MLAEIGAEPEQQAHDSRRGLVRLLRKLIQLFGIDIYIERRSVRVALHSLRGWYEVTDRLDAESLICLRLAELGFAREVTKLDHWPLVTLVSDRDLDALMADGVSDMHQHLGGFRSAHIIWLQLMAGHITPDEVPYFDSAAISALSLNPSALKQRIAERKRIEYLASAHQDSCDGVLWRHFFAPLAQLRKCLDSHVGDLCHPQRDVRVIGELVLRERIMLARGLARLIDLGDAGSNVQRRAEACRLEHALDLYIHAKSRFIGSHRQAIRSNPGLGRHRQFSDTTKLGWGWDARSRPPRTAEVESYEYSEASYFLTQSPALQRVELRLAPANAPQDYTRFLKAWSLVEDRLNRYIATRSHATLPKVRFSIHFKRSLDRRSGSQDDRMLTFLCELDAHSAALHEFRLDMHADRYGWNHEGANVSRFARIDFAGQERDIFPDRAAFAMNLLRGDEEALRLLDSSQSGLLPSVIHHGRWLELKHKGRLNVPVNLPRLGVTCHAGEDYAHPLEGIHAMMTAVEALKMRAGDSIGHGLAIGRDLARFHRDVAHQLTTSTGAQFDALAWLQATLVAHAPPDHMQAVARVEAWLWRKVMEIYPRNVQPTSLTAFVEVSRLRRGPVPEKSSNPSRLADEIWLMECWDDGVRKARRLREPIASILYEIEPSIIWAQEYVAHEIAKRGVVIEFNPSSNWRISQAMSPSEIPFIAVLRRFGTFVVACINTDNAGAYGTRIENEYAIALFGLMESGLSRTEAVALLDRIRLTGLNKLH